ncbi:double-stranded RNA-binding protein 2 [Andrographis paniculata]|uniref:double-stranded RNA-binding protein 2 n=1 Tax=Andrographis paniculata TaxID=175694 RepID=UPI0021E9A518|nr:double-stranded RNA-binding protein 2 [Andrographis paniculata]
MYKNQLQELAQRSCFNLPSYTCVREGPDHAPRFKAVVNFNGENFESPQYCSTLRQAEHSAAEAALASLSSRGPSHSLAARILDETGVYKNLLQEIAQRVGSPLPYYTTIRSGLGHLPVFTGTVELAGITFRGEPAKNKKQAEKNAALAAWLSLKQLAQQDSSFSSSEHENSNSNNNNDEQEQIRIARALQSYRAKQNSGTADLSTLLLPFHSMNPRPSSPQRPAMHTSKILPLFSQKPPPSRIQLSSTTNNMIHPHHNNNSNSSRLCRPAYRGLAPPVTLRTSVPVFSGRVMQQHQQQVAPPITVRQAVPVFSARPPPPPPRRSLEKDNHECVDDVDESTAVRCLEQLEI